jgi:uncharacterized repeat protein (TIGR01451 family)
MARRPFSIRRRSVVLGATTALLFGGLVGTPGTSAQEPPAPGEQSLFNLEHVFNFNPVEHDPGIPADPTAGSDVTFWTHSVPLRDYSTGAFIDEQGNPLPAGSPPVMAERDFAVVGSYQRGGYVFDITDPENPAFVNQVTCRQPRNDVGVKKFIDPETGETRVVLALTQQTGNPCGGGEDGGGVGVRVNAPANLTGFYGATQWVGTAPVAGQTANLVYAGTGCTPAQYVGVDVDGKIALVDKRVGQNPADQCPTFTFKQKMDAAETAGAIGLVQVDEDDPPSAGSAIASGIPGLEITNTDGVPIRNAVLAGTTVNVTLTDGPSNVPLKGSGSGGIGVFDVTDPFEWIPMYRFRTGNGGVHNFVFHPTAPYGYVSNGALPGGINVFPIIDFTDLDNPVLRFGPPTVGGHHDVTISLDETRAYVGSEDVWRIYDITDPANPVTISDTPNTGTYSHGVFTDSDREIALNNNESLILGGFFAPGVCPGEGLTAYDISGANENAPILVGEYLPDVTGPSQRPCTSHFGFFSPKEDPEIMSIGWYNAGVRVVDWSNPSLPVEIAHAVMNDADGIMNSWAAKFYKGPYIYSGDIDRGFDVFKWSGQGPAPWEAFADLALTKNGPARAPTARNFTYTVSVTNGGPDLAAGVLVTDDLPESVTLFSATPSQGFCGTTGLKVNCDLGVLESGASATVDIVVRPRQAGRITNTATVTSLATDQSSGNNSASVDTNVCRITSRPTSIPCP